ncbi:MAG: GNAT family N-acetyltransferase [Bacteroidales bacterium]|nr:GNAT family N-acetyltransferase [Bacteroidales bacterium]
MLRALEPEDLELLYRWENDTDIWNISETLSPISKYVLKRYLENAHKDIFETRQFRFMIVLNTENKSIGTIDLYDFDPFHKRAAVGILIAEKGQRKNGYASESLGLLKDYCFGVLKLKQIYCVISKENKSSIDLFLQSGFNITGTRKEWIWNGRSFSDEHFMQCFNQDL